MLSLLKADFFRVIKSKLLYIALILCILFPIILVALYLGLNEIAPEEQKALFNPLTLYQGSFSISNNIGIVICVFSSIFVAADITSGTLRNKIINGASRTKIYFSHLIVSFIFNLVTIIIYSSFTLLFSAIFFHDNFNIASTETLVYIIITGIISFIFITTITTFLALVTRSLPLTILFTILLIMVLSIFIGLISMTDISKFKYLVYLIPTYSNNVVPNNEMFICGLISYALFGALNITLALIIFNKRDIK